MATHQEVARRVGHFLDGKRDVASLDRIFLWLRTRSFGHASIRDLGDFVAHSDERQMGKAWRHSLDLYVGLRHALNFITKGQGTRDSLIASLRANMQLELPADTKKHLGIGQRAVRQIVERLIPRIDDFDGKKISLRGQASQRESEVLTYFTSRIRVRPAYTQQSLLSDFGEALSRNKLITPKDSRMGAAGAYLAIYALTKMHLCEITYDNAPPVYLRAGWRGEEDGPLVVTAASEGIDGIYVAVPLFETDCIAKEWCTKSLLESKTALGRPIELSNRWRLRPFK